jgi:hypothetical protein
VPTRVCRNAGRHWGHTTPIVSCMAGRRQGHTTPAHPVDAGDGARVDGLLHHLIRVHALLHRARAPARPPGTGSPVSGALGALRGGARARLASRLRRTRGARARRRLRAGEAGQKRAVAPDCVCGRRGCAPADSCPPFNPRQLHAIEPKSPQTRARLGWRTRSRPPCRTSAGRRYCSCGSRCTRTRRQRPAGEQRVRPGAAQCPPQRMPCPTALPP